MDTVRGFRVVVEQRCSSHCICSMQVVGGVGGGDGIVHCSREMRYGYPGS